MGQGACQAIEDAVVLADCLTRWSEVAEALRAYESLRILAPGGWSASCARRARLPSGRTPWRAEPERPCSVPGTAPGSRPSN